MLKRKILVLASAFLFFSLMPLFSEEVNAVNEAEAPERYQIIQQFKWKPSEKAKKYEVIVESFENGNWVPEMDPVRTEETSIQLLLYPGKKRVSIVSLNRLGRRGKATDWAEFIILDEMQPYLYADYLKNSQQWNSPLLRVTHAQDDDLSEDLSSESGDPENSFFLKGKNIFFRETKFYMVPVDQSSSGGRMYESFNKMRRETPLKLVRRDFDRSGVVVEYDPNELFSGYYQVVAENPGDQKTFLDILVLANREPVIDKDQFEYYPNYETLVLDAEKIKQNDNTFYLEGSGFTGDTIFTFTPSTSGIPYPFATSKDRGRVDLFVADSESLNDNGDMRLSFKVEPKNLPSGYYFLSAENSMGRSSVFLLVRDFEREAETPYIESVSTDSNDRDKVAVTLKGQNLSDEIVYTLISPMSETTGLSTRIPLVVAETNKKGKKIVLHASKEKLTPGVYGLLAEGPDTTVLKYVNFNNKFKSNLAELTLEEETTKFIRPVNFVASVTSFEETDSGEAELTYTPYEYKYLKRFRTLFPYLELDVIGGTNYWRVYEDDSETLVGFGLSFELVNFKFLHWGGDIQASYMGLAGDTYIRFSTTGTGFAPYIGAGVGLNYFIPNSFFAFEENKKGIYAFANIGVVLGNLIDISYTLHYSGADSFVGLNFSDENSIYTGQYFYDDITFGVKIPLGKYKREPKVVAQSLAINKTGIVSGADYKIRKDVKRIVFENGVTEIRQFNDNYKLTTVVIPDSVKVIGKDAFKNCINLKEVILPDGVVEICEGAFTGCRAMQKVVLPSTIRKISPDAFDQWEDYQYVLYQWSKDDTTVRDLGGLENQRNFTTIFDAARTPFEKDNVFGPNYGKGAAAIVTTTQIKKDGVAYYAFNVKGKIHSNDSYINYCGMNVGGRDALNYLSHGDGITFKYIGDNKHYNIVLFSADGNTRFIYNFYARAGENEITIPYRVFRYDEGSSKKYQSLKKMEFGAMNIDIAAENNFAGTMFELTVYGIETIMEKKKK